MLLLRIPHMNTSSGPGTGEADEPLRAGRGPAMGQQFVELLN